MSCGTYFLKEGVRVIGGPVASHPTVKKALDDPETKTRRQHQTTQKGTRKFHNQYSKVARQMISAYDRTVTAD